MRNDTRPSLILVLFSITSAIVGFVTILDPVYSIPAFAISAVIALAAYMVRVIEGE